MSNIIESFDLFGENVKIYLNQKEKFQTKFGGYLSIFIVMTTLVFVWFIGNDIIYKANPFNYQQQVAHKKFLNITIDKQTFPFAIGLLNINNTPLIDSSTYLNFELKYVSYTFDSEGNSNFKEASISLEKCNYNDFPTLSHEDFDNALIANYFCPKMNSTILHGYWSESSIKMISAVVKLCNFDKPENNCHSYEEIKSYISKDGVNFGLLVLEPQIVITNYVQPVQKYIINPYKFLADNLQIVNFFIEKNAVQTDSGILLESRETEEFFKLKELQTDTAFFDKNKKLVLQFNFLSSNLQTVHVRKYIKIPEILASIGGLFKLFTLIGHFINLRFLQISKNFKMISSLFRMEKDDVQEHNRDIIRKSLKSNRNNFSRKKIIFQSISNLHLNNINNRSNMELTITNNDLNFLLDKIRSRKPAVIKLSYSDYFYLICKRKKRSYSKNLTLYRNALKRIKEYFDIIFIINKLIEIEIIKDIFLNNTQKIILENIKPLLTEKIEGSANSNNFEEELIILFNSQLKTDLDHRLINKIISFH